MTPGPPLLSRGNKEWLHLNVFDHMSGAIVLLNASLHGGPADRRSRAVGTALAHLPKAGWAGQAEVRSVRDASVGPSSIALENFALAVVDERLVLATARFPEDAFSLDVTATAAVTTRKIALRTPFGSGWISWALAARLTCQGELNAGSVRIDLGGATAYHDRNWGSWRWADGAAWEWGAFLTAYPGPAFVLWRTTDRAHRSGARSLLVETDGRRRTFAARTVRAELVGELETRLRRLPGAAAALHPDAARVRLPERVRVVADDGEDRIELEFSARAAAQLVAAEPTEQGSAFINELVGGFSAQGRIGRRKIAADGLGAFEYVL